MSDKPEKPLGISSIARMAGNIAAGFLSHYSSSNVSSVQLDMVAKNSVAVARMIAKELEG